MHSLQPFRPCEKDKQRKYGNANIAGKELVEIPTLFLYYPSAGLPGGYLPLPRARVEEGWRAVMRWRRDVVGKRRGLWVRQWIRGIWRMGGKGRSGSAVHQPAIAKWLAEGFVESVLWTRLASAKGATNEVSFVVGGCASYGGVYKR